MTEPSPELEQWLEDHYDEEEGVCTFQPNELSFNISLGSDDPCDGPCAVITPTRYFKETGFMFDQHFEIPGLNWSALCEGMYELEGDDPRQHLLDLGLTEDTSMVWG